jgi:hypothetical protein
MERSRSYALIALFVLPLSLPMIACDEQSGSTDEDDNVADDDAADDDDNDDDNDDNNNDDAADDDDDDDASCDEDGYGQCTGPLADAFDQCTVWCTDVAYDPCLYQECLSECGIEYRQAQIDCANQYHCLDGVPFFECVIDCQQKFLDCLKPMLTCGEVRMYLCGLQGMACYLVNCAPL